MIFQTISKDQYFIRPWGFTGKLLAGKLGAARDGQLFFSHTTVTIVALWMIYNDICRARMVSSQEQRKGASHPRCGGATAVTSRRHLRRDNYPAHSVRH
jgi:hypothetical protein